MLFGLDDQDADIVAGIVEARLQRLCGKLRTAGIEIDTEPDCGKTENDENFRHATTAGGGFCRIAGRDTAGNRQQTASDLGPGVFGFAVGDQSLLAVAVQFAELVAIDGGLAGAVVGARMRAAQQRVEQRGRDGRREDRDKYPE